MASLLAKEGMAGKIQMVYFDPPYGISFKSNFQPSTNSREVKSSAADIPNEPAVVSCFRDTYERGIHSYLDNILKNATLARELLADEGSLFLQMGPANAHRLCVLLDEVFGYDNRIAVVPFVKSGSSSAAHLPVVCDYLLWYAKDKEKVKFRQIYDPLTREEKLEHMTWHSCLEMPDGSCRSLSPEERSDLSLLPEGARLFQRMRLTSMHESATDRSDAYVWRGRSYECPPNSQWRVSKDGIDHLDKIDRLFGEDNKSLYWKRYENEIPGRRINNMWARQMSPDNLRYVVETAEPVIERCMHMSTDPGDLVLDITCGSGTTAYVAEKWGRRWITTDTSGVAVSLARQRIATGYFDYFLLADSPEGEAKEAELSLQKSPRARKNYDHDVAKGFVYNRVPTVSAAILAYDQKAEPTYMVNEPYKQRSVVRVSSPFTVESESPYRYIPPGGRIDTEEERGFSQDQISAIKSALEKTGISGRKLTEEEKLRFTEITDYVQSSGKGWTKGKVLVSPVTHTAWTRIPGEEGSDMKAAIAIAPDDMTVSNAFIDRAAESAVKIINEGMLVVIAFAFEADVRSADLEVRGKLTIVKAQANRDLQIGNLHDSSLDHAFVMVGEPDVLVEKSGEDLITVEVLGFDTYDPATGNVEPGGAKEIDCWMIDSNYDGKSFYARHVHFPNPGDRQITRLKRKLGRNLDTAAWDAMVSHKSVPFRRPETGRIAVKIVTTTHTEMTTVIEV